jgi:hypothetical protein
MRIEDVFNLDSMEGAKRAARLSDAGRAVLLHTEQVFNRNSSESVCILKLDVRLATLPNVSTNNISSFVCSSPRFTFFLKA